MSSRRDDGLSIAVWEQSPWRAFVRFKDDAEESGGAHSSGRPGTGQPFREDTELAREILGRALDAARSKKNFVSASSVAQSRVESEAHLMAEDARRWRPGARRHWELSDEEDTHEDKHIDVEQDREAEPNIDSGDEASDERSPNAQPKAFVKQSFTMPSRRRFSDNPRPVGTPSSNGRRTSQRTPSQVQRRPNTSCSAGSREDGPLHSFPSGSTTHGWMTNAQQRPPSRLQIQVGACDLAPTPLSVGPLLTSLGSSPWPAATAGPWSGDGTPTGDVLAQTRSGGPRGLQSIACYSPHPPATPPPGGKLLQLQGAPALWRVQRVSIGPRAPYRVSDSSDGGGMRDTEGGGNTPTTPPGGVQGGWGTVFGGPLEVVQRQRQSAQGPKRISRPGDERPVVGFASDSPATSLLSNGPPYEINIVRPVSVPRLHAARMERLPSRAGLGTPNSNGSNSGRLTLSRQGSRPSVKQVCTNTGPGMVQGQLVGTGEASHSPRTPTPSGWVGRMLATPAGHYY